MTKTQLHKIIQNLKSNSLNIDKKFSNNTSVYTVNLEFAGQGMDSQCTSHSRKGEENPSPIWIP